MKPTLCVNSCSENKIKRQKSRKMVLRIAKVLVAVGLSLLFTISLVQLVFFFWNRFVNFDDASEGNKAIEAWLEENELEQYKELFWIKG